MKVLFKQIIVICSFVKNSCSVEAGRLLSVLVGQITQGEILEVGTGIGVGSSWILSSILQQ